MEELNERDSGKRFLINDVVAWVSLALSIMALMVSLRHSNQIAPKRMVEGLKPPDGYLLDPRKARVTDMRDNTFSWRDSVGDNQDGDHVTYGGWVADAERREFLAYGRASIRGMMRSGILALARPDDNRLHMEWPLKTRAGQKLRIICCLTDRAVQLTRRGAKIRLELSREGVAPQVLANDEQLNPGDEKVIEIAAPLAGNENKLTLELDNCGSEFWSVIYCAAHVE